MASDGGAEKERRQSSEGAAALEPAAEDEGHGWDLERGDQFKTFDFTNAGYTAALRYSNAGTWCSAVGDEHFETGVHYFAMRVNYRGKSSCPSPELASGWVLGVAPKSVSLVSGLDVEQGGLAYEKQSCTLGINLWDSRPNAFWSVCYKNFTNHPRSMGQIVANPPSILPAKEPLSHSGRMYDGDVIGMRVDVDRGQMSFYVGKTRIKELRIVIPAGGWVPFVSACTPAISFTFLKKSEQRDFWGEWEWQEITESGISGSISVAKDQRKEANDLFVNALTSITGMEEVENRVMSGSELPEEWFKDIPLDEAVVAQETLKKILCGVLGEESHADLLTHPMIHAVKERRERLTAAHAKFVQAQENYLAKAKESTRLKTAHEALNFNAESYRLQGERDFSITLGNHEENVRHQKLIEAAEMEIRGAQMALERAEEDLIAQKQVSVQSDRQLESLEMRKLSVLLRLFGPLKEHIQINTASTPTFSAPTPDAAEKMAQRRRQGQTVGDNELIAAKTEDSTGVIHVIVQSRSEGAKIYYTIDGSTPEVGNGSSVNSGGKILLSNSATIRAIALAPGVRPSKVVKSPRYVVRCGPPSFVGQSVMLPYRISLAVRIFDSFAPTLHGQLRSISLQAGKEKLRIQLRSGTSGVKIYYTFNSRDSTPPEFALEGGDPIKEEPYGTGVGKLDGSQPLRDPKTGAPRLNPLCAGVVENFSSIEVTTSGVLKAFACKPGVADSIVAKSNTYSIAGK